MAVAVPPVPPSTEVTAPVVLTWSPAAVASTSIERVHELFAGSTAPVSVRFVDEMVTRLVSQVPARLSGFAISKPAGILSLNPTPVRSVAGLGLARVNVSVTLLFKPTVAALKAFAIVGGDCARAPVTNIPSKNAAKTNCCMKRFM